MDTDWQAEVLMGYERGLAWGAVNALRQAWSVEVLTLIVRTADGAIETTFPPSPPREIDVRRLPASAGFTASGNRCTMAIAAGGRPVYWLLAEFPGRDNPDLSLACTLLQALVLNESIASTVYPTLLWALAFPGSDYLDINAAILGSAPLSFLNGQPGTGKTTFAQKALLAASGIFASSEQLKGGFEAQLRNGRFIYLPEVALANETQLEAAEVASVGDRIVLASAYDIEELASRGLVSRALADMCVANRIIFPSLMKRETELSNLAFVWTGLKARFAEPQLKLPPASDFEGNLAGLVDWAISGDTASVAAQSLAPMAWKEQLEGGGQLRDLVGALEAESIRIAHEKVGSSQNRIADFLGISRGSLQHKIKKYNLPYGDWEED